MHVHVGGAFSIDTVDATAVCRRSLRLREDGRAQEMGADPYRCRHEIRRFSAANKMLGKSKTCDLDNFDGYQSAIVLFQAKI